MDHVEERAQTLTEKNDEHTDTLDDIQTRTDDRRRQLSDMEPNWQCRTHEDEQTTRDFQQRIEPDDAELDAAIIRRWPDLSPGVAIPDFGGDWKSYSREVEKYVKEHGIDIDTDPLVQLLSADRAATICRRFDQDFGPTPWDRWDVAAVGITVVAGALLDYFLVATPGAAFKGEPQRGSPVTAWLKEQSEKLAPIKSGDDFSRNAFQEWAAGLTKKAEKWAKVPYDVVSPKLDLTPNTHRLAAIGHDPVLGIVFGAKDILCHTCTFIDSKGAWRVIPGPAYAERGVLEALATVVIHGFSDAFTSKGLPPPFLSALQTLNVDSGFALREGGDTVSVPNLIRYMYSNGYDLRHFATMAVVPAVAELFIRIYHFLRTREPAEGLGKDGIRGRLKLSQMLALTHGLLASGNLVKTALYGWNPTALNMAEFLALGKQMISLVKLSSERDALIQEELAKGWEALLAEAPART